MSLAAAMADSEDSLQKQAADRGLNLKAGALALKRQDVQAGEDDSVVRFCDGTVECLLQDKGFSIDLGTAKNNTQWYSRGEFNYDTATRRWKAQIRKEIVTSTAP